MPKKIQDCTMARLISVPLPVYGASYTVISHQFVIDYSKQQLLAAGFDIVDEEYRCTADGQIAQGIYKLNYNSDPELSMMFAWTNSYNKQVKFKCLVGAYINRTGSVMTSGDLGTWTRKHTGTADTETKDMIDSQIHNAHMYYAQLVSDKSSMEAVDLNKRRQAQMLGILFAEFQILTTEQASMIRNQMDRPTHAFTNSNTLWAFYNYVTIALQHSHPRTWMEDQRILHYFISTVCNLSAPVQTLSAPAPVVSAPVDPLTTNYGEPENQTNLLTQIEEFSRAQLAGVKAPEDVSDNLKESDPNLYHSLNHLAEAEASMLIHGDDTKFNNISDATEEAFKNQLIFGVSGIEVTAEGIRNVPIDELVEEMQKDNPILENIESESESDEIIGFVEEISAEDAMNKYGSDVLGSIEYTDPAGNTFEAPLVSPIEKDLEEEIRNTEADNFFKEVDPALLDQTSSMAPSPADYEMLEATESSEGTPAIADLDSVPVEKKDDFDLDFSESDDTEEAEDNTPDFF